ncbi:MAG: hypothetical protein WDO74_17915 [Pseudomonadota bacterium]
MAGLRVTNLESGHVARVAWTTSPALYDIIASDPYKGNLPGLAAPSEGRPCRRIIVLTSGTLVFTGLDGVDVTTPSLPSGFVLDVQATALKAASTAQNVLVIW